MPPKKAARKKQSLAGASPPPPQSESGSRVPPSVEDLSDAELNYRYSPAPALPPLRALPPPRRAAPAASATPKKRKSHTLDELPATPTRRNLAGDAPGLPCVKCAKRLIVVKDTKNATKDDKASDKQDGMVNSEALSCRWSPIKCYVCKSGRKVCLEIENKTDRTLVRRLLRRAIATQAHVGVLSEQHLRANIDLQAMVCQCMEFKDESKKQACLRQGVGEEDSDSELE